MFLPRCAYFYNIRKSYKKWKLEKQENTENRLQIFILKISGIFVWAPYKMYNNIFLKNIGTFISKIW